MSGTALWIMCIAIVAALAVMLTLVVLANRHPLSQSHADKR